jgi:ornithine cyclodeaminase/alanine dehydrogenase
MREIIDAVENGYREKGKGAVVIPPRTAIEIARYNGFIHFMPAYLSDIDALAVKIVTTHVDNPKRNLPTVAATIIVYDPSNGTPLAIMDGTYITAMRTGAAGAVAAKYLARKDAANVTIVGTGVQGRSQLIGLCHVRNVKKVFAHDVDQKRCQEYVTEMKKSLKVDIAQVQSLQRAVEDSDIVVTASTSRTPVIMGDWLREGCHVSGFGSHTPETRELDENVMKRSSRIVLDTIEAKSCGDIAYPLSKNMISERDICEIGDIVVGKKVGRTSTSEITVFKSVGTAILDASVSARTYQLAKEKGIGRTL